MTLRDLKLTILFLLGFMFTYVEGRAIQYLNSIYSPGSWYPYQDIVWMFTFGIPHSIILIWLFGGGRFTRREKNDFK